MNLRSKEIFWVHFIGIAAFLIGCSTNNQQCSKDLVVAEQTDSVFNQNGERAFFTLDVPVNGPQALVDSVLVLLNYEMYHSCECCVHFDEEEIQSFRPEEVFTDNGERFLSHYMEKYKVLIQDSFESTIFGLTAKLEAQTETFVTYRLEYFHCGASCGSEKYYYTFHKHDGHQIKEIISHERLLQFFEDYPEHCGLRGDPWMGWPDWEFTQEHEFIDSDFGLCHDHLSLVISGVGNHYLLMNIPYGQILSYLSLEAQALVEGMGEVIYPTDEPCQSEDGEVWLEIDTANCSLLSYINAAGGPLVNTLIYYDPELEIYPKHVHSISADEGETVFLLIYSRGHLLYCDEAMTCVIKEHRLQPKMLFALEEERDSVISCMWYDQLVEASNGFPYEEVDENRFGIHYDWFKKRLYVPVMEHHEERSGFENCLRYTGRYDVLQFNGKEFVPAGTDGAWWLNPDMRNYKRTVSNKKTSDGIEQIDLMPDGTYRCAFWKGAKTLDDLRKKPDEVKESEDYGDR